MSDLPRVYTVEPLVPISDEDLAYRAKLDHWTMTDALFWLSGHRSPGYESTRHMQDHFWDAYMLAVHAIEAGKLCRKIERAGKTIFMDSPKNWLAWADRIGPEYIKVDERMRRALSQMADPGKRAEAPKPAKATRSLGAPIRFKARAGIFVVLEALLLDNSIEWLEEQTIDGLGKIVRQKLPEFEAKGKLPRRTQMGTIIKDWLADKLTLRAAKNDQSPLSR